MATEAPTALPGGTIDLACDSVFSAFGIQLSFINLCDQQAMIKFVTSAHMPANLPDNVTFAAGVNIQIRENGQTLPNLPDGSGIELDFPITGGTNDQFAVLYWNGSKWVEITQTAAEDQVAQLVETNAAHDLYRIESTDGDFCKVLTTEETGIFVLVKR